MHTSGGDAHEGFGERLVVGPLGLDDFSSLRHLHARSLRLQTIGILSEEEIEAFIALVRSTTYSDLLLQEEIYGAWFDGELVGTASWQAAGGANSTARIGGVFVRHPRLGIGRRLITEVERRACRSGFFRFTAWATANAVPFYRRLSYHQVSSGIKALSPECALPVAFLRKSLASRPRSATLM